ncbi:MAG: glycosyltransferase [Deltaproteobacteria bacterium]|nr:glycosyltransferase [Deltaproteobacteria bacterium]
MTESPHPHRAAPGTTAQLPRRVALVHDWLVTLRGGERVLDALCELFPDATLHTLVREPGIGTPRIEAMHHAPSLADRVPGARRRHRWLLPLYPTAIEALDLSAFDLVVSSSHCVAKGAIAAPGAVHVCYSHTPVRYAWDRTDDYLAGMSPAARAVRPAIAVAARWLRGWDKQTAGRVDAYVANSHNTARKIKAFYGREATVVPPPVECARFASAQRPADGGAYDLVLGGLVPYKRVDLAVAAYATMPDRPLVVVGDGPERGRLQAAAPRNVTFVGRAKEADLARWYAGARLLVFPGEEDFGIVPLEAQACGVPVVALGRGGALESVVEGRTGAFFAEESPAALRDAIGKVATADLDPQHCRDNAARFDRPVFLGRMAAAIAQACAAKLAPLGRAA